MVVATVLPDGVEQVDRPALQARIARIEVAVAVEVVVNVAGHVHELEVAEIEPGVVRRWSPDRCRCPGVDGLGLVPAGLVDLLDRV